MRIPAIADSTTLLFYNTLPLNYNNVIADITIGFMIASHLFTGCFHGYPAAYLHIDSTYLVFRTRWQMRQHARGRQQITLFSYGPKSIPLL